MLQSVGSQRVGHDLVTEQQQDIYVCVCVCMYVCVCVYIYTQTEIYIYIFVFQQNLFIKTGGGIL